MGILMPSGIGMTQKISGAVSMDDNGVIVAPGNMGNRIKLLQRPGENSKALRVQL